MMSEAKLVSSGLIPSKPEATSSCSIPASSITGDSEDNKSSSTEGPDSPDQSSSASPIPPSMMIPSSPLHTSTDFQPLYSVRFTDHITKNGDIIKYRLNVRRIRDLTIITIDREYGDFEYLHHALSTTSGNIEGICLPPLPLKPSTDPHSAEARAKKQVGSGNRVLRGDDFARDCSLLEKYLYMALSHPLLGTNAFLKEFLENSEPPLRAKIKKGLFQSVLHNLDYRKCLAGPDLDETFQKERDWLQKYTTNIKKTCETYHQLINCRLRLANQLSNLSHIASVSVGEKRNIGINGDINRLTSKFSVCLIEDSTVIESLIASEDITLGVYLDLYSNYTDSVNDMMMKRTTLMIEYDNASKALAKAKLSKIGAAKVAKDTLENRYSDCSHLAKTELKRFHQRRITEMKEAIVFYAEGQVKAAREASGGLKKAMERLKLEFHAVPVVEKEDQV
ncbi:sorting nexin-5 [Lepeophtheirus salmonis]|uniref:sorting nexin-5 n=1 Tax=Lepeophtheirus salmonis TaxID=72036 RepID=UPI001AEA9369|nr:sorting nexin-5-like [Lepeophtheirus salmonis]